mmetsp:Transcript_25998/g.52192  ORF Transcript_25998/g.52192 Transcript_25998/m.52192 type:complete len:936 (+) Transcript_25998:91-2898(+)
MRRIKVGKGLLRSLFPSSSKNKKKKASSSSKNKSSSAAGAASNNTPVNNGSSAFNCPTILGGGRRKVDERPYELHQEGASLPPSPGGEGRDHEHNFGGGGVGEKELQLTSQQQQGNDVKREANFITPITVACSLSEEQDNELEEEGKAWNKMAITETIEVEVEATEEKEQAKDMEHCAPQQTQDKQGDESFDTALFDHQNFPSSPSKDDETRRRAIARQQRILSQASTRFQALSETATIDTSGFSYCSPPHLQRRRWQQHIGRQTKPQVVDDGNQQGSSSRGQSIIGLPPRQQQQQQLPPQANKNYSSVVFYDSTPTRDLATNNINSSSSSSSDLRKHQEGQISSPTCVADMMENFEVSTPGHGNKGAVKSNQVISSNDSTCTSTAADNNVHFFILLLCPSSRIFEVIQVSDAPLDSTVGDVLKLIPHHITDGRLLKKKFIGLCRPADRTEFIDLTSPAFLSKKERQGEDCTPFDFIHQSDVLVAILKGSTCYQMSKISKPILRNPKFKEMIRRRRRQSAADKAARKKKRKSKKKHNDKLQSPTKEIYVPDDCSVVSGITCAKPVRSRNKEAHRGEDPTSLSKMLETLSKKLHEVEEDGAFVAECDNSSMGSSNKQRSVTSDLDQAKRRAQEGQSIGFKMSPKMLAMELAQTIEDIFADNNVEIVAVDADDNDGDDSRINDDDDDSDTFVSARSHRTKSTVATLKSAKKPRNVVIRTKTSPRQFKFTETMEDNALAAQIEAMAAQADAAFEDRSKKNSSRGVAETTAAIDKARSNSASPVSDLAVSSTEGGSAEVDCDNQDLSESFETSFGDALSHIECENVEGAATVTKRERKDVVVAAKVPNRASKDTVARKFLNASTSTVSKMVADNQGRVNEVHVLESLGCTIVCIAANYMQLNRQKGKSSSIETKDVLQSATFLAFMVSGQRYLAKVTDK